jgi:glycosyltransferase involved in cell wall biosynthesis
MAMTHRWSKSSWLKYDADGADFLVNPAIPLSCFMFFGELWRFYKIVLRYKIVHCHSLCFPSYSGWELPALKKTGTKIAIHYRGCDIRDPDLYKKNQKEWTACGECEYPEKYCKNRLKIKKIRLAEKCGDIFFVTTPDLLDFVPNAVYLPFFLPLFQPDEIDAKRASNSKFEIVHATNHEGIDGTKYLINAAKKLNADGFDVCLNIIKRMPYRETLSYYKGADMSAGKLNMGFYANSQIESMLMGTATACWIREDLKKYLCGMEIIEINPDTVYSTLKTLLTNLEKTKEIAFRQQEEVKSVHNNQILVKNLVELYKSICKDLTKNENSPLTI